VAAGLRSLAHERPAALHGHDEALLLEQIDRLADGGERAAVQLGKPIERREPLAGRVLAALDAHADVVGNADLEWPGVGETGGHCTTV
jgi:hypothetical protein